MHIFKGPFGVFIKCSLYSKINCTVKFINTHLASVGMVFQISVPLNKAIPFASRTLVGHT